MKFFLLSILQVMACTLAVDFDSWLNIRVDHTLACNNEKFCKRGQISLKSIRMGNPLIDQITFDKQHIEELKALAEINGFYTLRSICTSSDNKETEYLSSMRAQAFLDSNLSEVINVWMLPNGGIAAVNFQADNSSQTLTGINKKLQSKFYLHHVEQAPVPDTASYIQKLEREREAKERGEVKDNKSFLAKYWMYIVPVVVFVMISGAANPEPVGQSSR